jgi:hypothetical protein
MGKQFKSRPPLPKKESVKHEEVPEVKQEEAVVQEKPKKLK